MEFRKLSSIVSVLLSFAGVGCYHNPPAQPPRHVASSLNVVPALPPDSIPRDFYAASNIVTNSPYMTLSHVRNTVKVYFHESASQEQRQAAVDKVNGQVVGGDRWGSDGFYYVRITANDDGAALKAAKDLLKTLPQVREAMYTLVNMIEGG